MIIVCCYGVVLVGYVLLSVFLLMFVFDNKGVVMLVLNLGFGLCVFIVLGIVSFFIGLFGVGGVIWIFVLLYFFSVFLI